MKPQRNLSVILLMENACALQAMEGGHSDADFSAVKESLSSKA